MSKNRNPKDKRRKRKTVENRTCSDVEEIQLELSPVGKKNKVISEEDLKDEMESNKFIFREKKTGFNWQKLLLSTIYMILNTDISIRDRDICYTLAFHASKMNLTSHYQSYSECVSMLSTFMTPFRYFQNTAFLVKHFSFFLLLNIT